MFPLHLDPDEETLCTPEFLRFLQRNLGAAAKDLCCYRVRRNGRFCIGKWVNRDRGLVYEIMSYGTPAEITHSDVEFVKYWLSDRRLSDNRDAVRYGVSSMARQDLQEHQNDLDERREFRQYLARKADLPEEALISCT